MPYSTQKTLVLNHLRQHGHISSWEAITTYHISRLSEYIRSLRHDDFINITDEWQENNHKRFKVYHLSDEVRQDYKLLCNGQYSLV